MSESKHTPGVRTIRERPLLRALANEIGYGHRELGGAAGLLALLVERSDSAIRKATGGEQ